MWWGLGASIILWELTARAEVIGLDALVSFVSEKWEPVRQFIGRHHSVRWLWLGPVFSWLAHKTDEFHETQRQKTQGKSFLRVWRDKRRAMQETKRARAA